MNLNIKLLPVDDIFFQELRQNWFSNCQKQYSKQEYITTADEWFKSTKRNKILGWDDFKYVDPIVGCTQFIESIIMKYGLEGFQILSPEYAYYQFIGKQKTIIGNLEPNKPLLVSLPNFWYCDILPRWNEILDECEKKNIDIHLDMAWITTSTDIEINLAHPNIKSFAMSLSKYSLQWNRIGLRWTKKRTMDSISISNHYYNDTHAGLMSCGVYIMNNVPRDYIWDTYGEKHVEVCNKYNLRSTKFLHVAKKQDEDRPYGIAHLILPEK